MDDRYTPTARTTASRMRDRMSYERAAAHAVLDEGYDGALGFVVDDRPRVLPMLHVRIGDRLYLHGSTGGRPLLAARGEDLPVCYCVTLLDGLVYARSQFHHSANYRSVVVHGRARPVADEGERRAALTALVDKSAPGRSADSRPPTDRELAQTALLVVPLVEVSVRSRSHGVVDEPHDHSLPHWAGVVPLRRERGLPRPDDGVTAAVPAYLRPLRSPWHETVTLQGHGIVLEPLDLSHVDGLFAATADDEVWRHLRTARPRDGAMLAGYIDDALQQAHDGERVPFVIREAATGTVLGTTSYYQVQPEHSTVAIGHTIIGRPWWGTGVNVAAKSLLLGRAFAVLGAQRVELHTDVRNVRSQRAIEALGAAREGILRRHRRRSDGSWRDTVLYAITAEDWPTVAARLRDRLAAAPDRAG